LASPYGDVCADEENAGGAQVEVAFPESVDVLLAVAVAVALALCAVELVALQAVRRYGAAEGDGPGVEDARLWLDETAGLGKEVDTNRSSSRWGPV
jgi:hypothetical protein